MALLTLNSCSVDDDTANIAYDFAEITDSTFPEFFEPGKSYDLKLTYKRPTTCHNFIGVDGGREDANSNEIFLYALTSFDPGATGCDSSNAANLSAEYTLRGFSISDNIADDEVFVFKLWIGEDASGEPIFTTVEVPVGDPELAP